MSSPATSLSKDDVATLERIFHIAIRLIREGDIAGWAALCAENAVIHPPNAPAVHGRTAIQQWGEAFFPQLETIDSIDPQIDGDGNMAYGTAGYTLAVKDAPPDRGKQLVVFRRGTSGWQAVALTFNSDLPLPAPVALT